MLLRSYYGSDKKLYIIAKGGKPVGKRIVASAVMVVLVLSMSICSASARWDADKNCDKYFSIDNNVANCYLNVRADSNRDRITATVQIVRINSDESRTPVKAWNNLSGTGILIFDEEHPLTSSGTYRMYYSVDVAGVDSISGYEEASN